MNPNRSFPGESSRRARLMLVEDHPLFRLGLRQVIERDERFEIVAEADQGQSALEIIRCQKPDLVILDINLPQMNGLQLIDALRAARASARLVVLTMYDDAETFNRALDLGVMGYVLKENAVSEIVNCLSSVLAGNPYVTPLLSRHLLQRRRSAKVLSSREGRLEELTTAEGRILKLISQGKSNKEMAALLFISPRTVEAHRANIRAKLALKGDQGLLRFAIENQHAISQLNED